MLCWDERLERPVYDLTECRVNMDRVADWLVRSVSRIHHWNDLVYEDRCVGTDDVRSKDLRGLCFNNYLDEIVLHIHSLALSRIFVLLKSNLDLVLSQLFDRFLLSHPDTCDLRVSEYCMGDCVIVGFDLLFQYCIVVDYL